jgi:hypothetical protein
MDDDVVVATERSSELHQQQSPATRQPFSSAKFISFRHFTSLYQRETEIEG